MKKLVVTLMLVSLVLIVWILYSNKQKTQEMSKIEKFNSYPVSVFEVKKVNVANSFSQVGEIVAEHDVAVIAETQGKVIAVMADVGDYVSAGAAIVKVDDELPKAKFLAVKTNYEKAKKDYERFEVLLKEGIISDSEFETALLAYEAAEAEYTAARRDYRNAAITAPISGLITIRPVTFGTMITPGMVVANIVDITKLNIKVNLAERDVFRLKAGDPAVITTDVYPTIKFKGQVKSISVKGDEAHTFTVETIIGYQKEHPLKSGMFGRVTFYQPTDAPVLTIPREALIGSIKNAHVYVVKNNIAHLQDIVVSRESSTSLVVLQGLNEGQQVVISGQDNLEDNSQVSVKSNLQRGDRDDLN